MKKKTKKFFGILGLGLVAATTSFAITLPSPDAAAVSSVTDTITVRVVSSDTSISIIDPKNEDIYTTPNHKITVDYANVDKIEISALYTNASDESHEVVIATYNNLDYQIGTLERNINLDVYGSLNDAPLLLSDQLGDYIYEDDGENINISSDYGFGEYLLKVKGIGASAYDEKSVSFSYFPFTCELVENDDGTFSEVCNYDHSVVDKLDIAIIRNSDSKTVWTNSITDGSQNIMLPFGITEDASKADQYTIKILATNALGDILYKATLQDVDYENIVIPDTGAFFRALNISRTDYLITGIIIFFSFAVFAFVYTSKRRKAYRYNYARKNNRTKKANYTAKKSSARKPLVNKNAITRIPKKKQSYRKK